MNEDYIVIDDFTGDSYARGLEDNAYQLKWVYNNRTYTNETGQAVCLDENTIDSPQMISIVYGTQNPNMEAFSYIKPMFHKIEDILGKKIEFITRVKYNLLNRNPNFTKENYNVPHLDMFDDSFITALYYVNDSDGDTVLFNEKHSDEKPNRLTIRDRISPKRGRLLLFKGNIWHASSNPINSNERIVINSILKIA